MKAVANSEPSRVRVMRSKLAWTPGSWLVGLGLALRIGLRPVLAVLVALGLMRTKDLQTMPTVARAKGQLREGFAYVWRTPQLRTPLLMMATIGTLTYEFAVTLPLLAKFSFGGDAGTYAAMSVVMASGSVVGGLPSGNATPHGASVGRP